MKTAAITASLMMTLALAASAACPGCVSKGVKVSMKDGSVRSGYIPWSLNDYKAFFGPYGRRFDKAVRPLLQERGWSLKRKCTAKEAFERWLEILNYAFVNEVVEDSRHIEALTLYTRLERIRYPFTRFLGVKGEVSTLDPNAISEIAASPEHTLSADMSFVDVLAMRDIQRLKDEKPRFVIEHKQGVSGDVYAVYGDIGRREVLDHIFNRHGGVLDAIEVDSKPLASCVDEACTGFIRMREEYAAARREELESCRAPGRELYTRMRKAPPGAPERRRLKHEAYKVFAACKRLEQSVLERHAKSLGSKEELRGRGIIIFSYAWD